MMKTKHALLSLAIFASAALAKDTTIQSSHTIAKDTPKVQMAQPEATPSAVGATTPNAANELRCISRPDGRKRCALRKWKTSAVGATTPNAVGATKGLPNNSNSVNAMTFRKVKRCRGGNCGNIHDHPANPSNQ